jgi:hypothetical protein
MLSDEIGMHGIQEVGHSKPGLSAAARSYPHSAVTDLAGREIGSCDHPVRDGNLEEDRGGYAAGATAADCPDR